MRMEHQQINQRRKLKRHSEDFIRMLGATAHAVLSRMRRCIAIGGHQVESYQF
jgi:hypothetical protein